MLYDIAIIGAGPAGLAAALYARRAGLSAILLEGNIYGGQVANTPEVENYPGILKMTGVELCLAFYNQAMENGAELKFEGLTKAALTGKTKLLHTASNVYEAKAVIIANGAKRRKIGCEGEERLAGKGVSYCATCDGAFFRGKHVAIVGGGNTALEDALFLSNNCEKVYLIHRRDEFRGVKTLADAVKQRDNIEICYDSIPNRIEGSTVVDALVIQNKNSGEERSLPVKGVFVAIGLEPDNTLFTEEITIDPTGYIKAGEDCKTNLVGVYAAGDTRTKGLRQIVTAVSDGATAAVEASNYINENY